MPTDRPREWSRRRDRSIADAAGVDGRTVVGLAFRRPGGWSARGDARRRRSPTGCRPFHLPRRTQCHHPARPRGPRRYLRPRSRPRSRLMSRMPARREVGDAFELIWPTGEVDEELLGDPLSEEPATGRAPQRHAPSSGASPSPEPITVPLTPVTPPSRSRGASGRTRPVPDDVVLAVQRAIAAIGPEEAKVDEPSPAPRLPDPSTGSDQVAVGGRLRSATGRSAHDASAVGADRRPTIGAQAADQRVAASLTTH